MTKKSALISKFQVSVTRLVFYWRTFCNLVSVVFVAIVAVVAVAAAVVVVACMVFCMCVCLFIAVNHK